MMKKYYFTLTELLVTMGIIIILAGLAIPAVLTAQAKGRVTAAKADMTAILTALKSMEGTYRKMVNANGHFGTVNASAVDSSSSDGGTTYNYVRLGFGSSDSVTAYNYFIVELTNPKKFTSSENLNINRRRIAFLDPKTEYDPVTGSNAAGNISDNLAVDPERLWRDPWGNPYVIIINTNFTGAIRDPRNTGDYISANAIVYSVGPNGVDDNGNSELNDDGTGDDICSWR